MIIVAMVDVMTNIGGGIHLVLYKFIFCLLLFTCGTKMGKEGIIKVV